MKKILFIAIAIQCMYSNAQNVGIGVNTPAAPLHIKSNGEVLRLDGGSPYLSFYNSGTYKGFLWYDGTKMVLGTSTNEPILISPNNVTGAYFTTNGRLGVGTASPSEKLDVNGNINANGNINTNGDINLNGLLKINNSSGTAGQVLTSNGTSDPIWANSAYSNTTRFGLSLAAYSTPSLTVNQIYYNQNPTDITTTFGTSNISINKSGLYHLAGSYLANVQGTFSKNPLLTMTLVVGGTGGFSYDLCINRQVPVRTDVTNYYQLFDPFSIDLYLQSGMTVRFTNSIYTSSTPSAADAYVDLFGHLISQ